MDNITSNNAVNFVIPFQAITQKCNPEETSKLRKQSATPVSSTPVVPSTGKAPIDAMISYTVDSLKLKRFKCSECPYRSNFRSDVGRHIRHKHDKAASRIVLIPQVSQI